MLNKVDISNYKLIDLIDNEAFTTLLESFFKATGVPSGVVAEDGEIISQVGWVSACAHFHRLNPLSNQHCISSNLELMDGLQDGEITFSKCQNGLLDYATPVVIEGQRLATIFLGQVFNEAPLLSYFEEQANKYDYDQNRYIEAINSVPIISNDEMIALMECVVGMAKMLASSGLATLRQKLLQQDLQVVTQKHIQLEDILNYSPVGVGWSDQNGKIEYVNEHFTELFGYTLEDIPDLDTWYTTVYPDKEYREKIVEPQYAAVEEAHKKGLKIPKVELNITCKDKTQKHVIIGFSYVGEKQLVNFSDMTAHWKSEKRNQAHDKMLEKVAKGSPLPDILHTIVLAIESEEPSAICSILLLDEEGKHLHNGASLRLPKFYAEAIDGIEIGPKIGSCGSAAYLKRRVIVEDIMTHENWQGYTNLAKAANLRSCWSEPIVSSEGQVLGTFAIYHEKPSKPNSVDKERIGFATNLAAIAIENKRTQEELEKRAYTDYLTGLANRRSFMEKFEDELSRLDRYGGHLSLLMFDIDWFKRINDTYGHNIGDRVLQKISTICSKILREVDIVGRIGGEEFAVVLPQTDIEKALQVAQRLRTTIEKTQMKVAQNGSFNFTVSMGVTQTSAGKMDVDELLKEADRALYTAKESGRNLVCIAES
ncbi:diguanylate cyclase [Sulfurimonas sp.]|uniref:diguanylate cyclase n=1 Tax=Sulfurimonas sp. TaxID=2022749 RepID=UPI003D150E81